MSEQTQTFYRGVAPLTIVRGFVGAAPTILSVYVDQIVPTNADPADVERLVAEGYLEAVEVPVAVEDSGPTELEQQYAEYVAAQDAKLTEVTSQLAAAEQAHAEALAAKDREIEALKADAEKTSGTAAATGGTRKGTARS